MLTIFILYLAVTVLIAWWYSRGSRTNEEFVLGNKRFSGTALALSERATGESAWLLLGLTGYAFSDGVSAIWVALGCVIGIIFIWLVMAGRLRTETERTGALTIPGLLGRKFPESRKAISMISALIIIFFFLFYIAAQFAGSGKVLEKTFGLDPLWGIIIGSAVVTIYCIMGGFVAVVVTDVFQSVLMIFTLVVFPVIAVFVAAAHNINFAESLSQAGPEIMSLTHLKIGGSAMLFIISGMSWALGYTGQPQLLSRMMAIRNDSDVKKAKWVAISWTLLAYAGAILIGLFGIAFVKSGFLGSEAGKLAEDAEKILPVMVVTLVNPLIAGILLSGVISAMMSTASTELTVSSASMTEDIISMLKKKEIESRRKLWLNRLMTMAIGIIAIFLALYMSDTVYGLVSYAWSGIGSSFGPALLLVLFWKRFSRAGVFASLISGTVGTIVWKTFFESSTGVSERLTSFVFAFLMAVFFSLIFPPKAPIPIPSYKRGKGEY
jgi:sodium/proline symporter